MSIHWIIVFIHVHFLFIPLSSWYSYWLPNWLANLRCFSISSIYPVKSVGAPPIRGLQACFYLKMFLKKTTIFLVLKVPGSEDVLGEVAWATPAEDRLGGEGGGWPGDGHRGDHQPYWVATNEAEAITAALKDLVLEKITISRLLLLLFCC